MQTSRTDASLIAGTIAALFLGLAGTTHAFAGPFDPPNPFENLKTATAEVTSFSKANPNVRPDLRSSDIDTTLKNMNLLLNLTPYEQSVIRQRLVTRNEAVRRTVQADNLSEELREVRLEAIYRDTEAQVAAVMTPDQQLHWKIQQGQMFADDAETRRADKMHALDARAATASTPQEAVTQWGDLLEMNAAQRNALLPAIQAEFDRLDAVASDHALKPDEARLRVQEAMVIAERSADVLMTPAQKSRLDSLLNFLPTTGIPDNPRASAIRATATVAAPLDAPRSR